MSSKPKKPYPPVAPNCAAGWRNRDTRAAAIPIELRNPPTGLQLTTAELCAVIDAYKRENAALRAALASAGGTWLPTCPYLPHSGPYRAVGGVAGALGVAGK